MTDREKVIKRLETAVMQMHGPRRYTREDVDELEMAGWDALAFLEEQEPRVMTLQEAIDYGYDYGESGEDCDFPPVFIEYFDDRKCYVHWWVAAQVNMSFNLTVMREDYNKATPYGFRLWTSCPTEEQRKAVKWDG